MTRKKLVAKEADVVDIDGKYMFTVAMSNRLVDLINDVGFDEENESWLEYRQRTREERESEELKRTILAKELVEAYNEKYQLT